MVPNPKKQIRSPFCHSIWNSSFDWSSPRKYLDRFNTDVPIVFDDVNRESERILMEKVSKKIGRDYVILEDDMFGVII